jgi:hypothetical protein
MGGRKKVALPCRSEVAGRLQGLYILYIVCSSVAVEGLKLKGNKIGSGEVFQFEALQCDNAHALARYSSKRFCDNEAIKQESGVAKPTEGGEYAVIQYSTNKYFKAMMCEKKVSVLNVICGAFSHSKLIEPPDVLKPMTVKRGDCNDIALTQILTTEDGRQLRVTAGTRIAYKYLEAGSTTLTTGNVACEGGEVKIGGKKHDNVVKLVTVDFKLTKLDVEEIDGRLRIASGFLPRSCAIAYEGCALEDMTLVIDAGNVDACPYREIRRAVFQRVQMDGKSLVINDEHKLLLELGPEAVLPNACPGQGVLKHTNFKKLFLYQGDLRNAIVPQMAAREVDLELEERATDFYMEYWALMLSRENQAAWQSEMCELSANRLNEEQVVIHGDHMLRMKGELIHEFKCERIRVTAKGGFDAEDGKCLDHLPVFTEQRELTYLAPLTRLLVPRSAVSVLNCSNTFPMTVEDVQGRMVAANPAVGVVDVELSQYHSANKSHPNHTELFDVGSLLYTQEEVADYEQMLLGPTSERAVTRQFSSYYCQATGVCSPSRGSDDFKWSRMLQDPSMVVFGWWEETKEWLLWWGAVWGCVSSLMTGIQLLVQLVTVCCHLGRTDVDRGSVWRFMFMPGHELLRMFPAKKKEEPRRTQPGTHALVPVRRTEAGEETEMSSFVWST